MAKTTEKTKEKTPATSRGKTPVKGTPKTRAAKQAKPKTTPKATAEVAEKVATKSKSQAKGQEQDYRPRLKQLYHKEIVAKLQKQVGYKNIWQVPRLDKIILNMGLGDAREDGNLLKSALDDLAVITGQKALVTYAKKPISNFKIRANDPVGAKVTLRSNRMYEFLDRLLSLAIPRVRDFRGLPNKSFDGRGNYSFGITEQIVFPEIDYDKIDRIRGMDITFVTTAKTDEEAYDLMRAFGFPFQPRPQSQTSDQGARA
ncbi:MAG: 50S ribosomal protein L5 [Candidatus Marinimicrobia bacterium]|nr:50S ribosomal protein L5 [Candidatus Neomarinimicrobiota bacterium]